MFFVFLPGGISKEWRHIISANCNFEGETLPIVPMFTGLSGNTWETAKIAHESHNDVRRLCWHADAIFVLLAELGRRKPPSGDPRFTGRRLHLPASAVLKQSPSIGGNRGSVQRILGRERAYMEEKGLPSSLPQGEGGCKSRPHFKIAFSAFACVHSVIFTGGS